MPRGSTSARATRVAGIPLLVAFASAATLTGAAFLTVSQASCADPASYVRNDGQVQLVGGCVDPAELPGIRPGSDADSPGDQTDAGFYRP